MFPAFRMYIDSFKLKKVYWQTFLADLIGFTFIFALLTGAAFYLKSKFNLVQQSLPAAFQQKTIEELKELVAANPDQFLPFFQQLNSLLLTGIVAIFIIMVLSLLAYSFSQSWIWNRLLQQKVTKKTYWRWNGLNLILLLPLAILGIAVLFLEFIVIEIVQFLLQLSPSFYLAHQSAMNAIQTTFDGLITFFLVLGALAWMLLAYYSFAKEYKIWLSIGNAFSLFRSKLKPLLKMLGLVMITAIVLMLFLLLLRDYLLVSYPTLSSGLWWIISLLFMAWLRIYLVETVK